MADPTPIFWDSNVFISYLGREDNTHECRDIAQYLDEARSGAWEIWASSLTIVEVLPSRIKRKDVGSFSAFVEDFRGAIRLMEPNANILALAAEIRDLPYKKGDSIKRRVDTPDSIHLATCLHLSEVWGVKIRSFHTFDDGKRKSPDGKCVPLLSYQTWCEGIDRHPIATRVIGLNREIPKHPSPNLIPPNG